MSELIFQDDVQYETDRYDRLAIESFLFGPYAAMAGLSFMLIRRMGWVFRLIAIVYDLANNRQSPSQLTVKETAKLTLQKAIPPLAQIAAERKAHDTKLQLAEQQRHRQAQQRQREKEEELDLRKMILEERSTLSSTNLIKTLAEPGMGGNISKAVYGGSGSGKSLLVWHICFESKAMGIEVHLVDMSNAKGKWDFADTSRGFGSGWDVAGFEDAMLTLEFAERLFIERDQQYQAGKRDFPPVLIWIDESHTFINSRAYVCPPVIREKYSRVREVYLRNGRKLGLSWGESTQDNLNDSTGDHLELFRNFNYVIDILTLPGTGRMAKIMRFLGRNKWYNIACPEIPQLYDPDGKNNLPKPIMPQIKPQLASKAEPYTAEIAMGTPPYTPPYTPAMVGTQGVASVPMSFEDVICFLRQTDPVCGYDKIATLGLVIGSHGERKAKIKEIEQAHTPTVQRPPLGELESWLMANVERGRVDQLKLNERRFN